MLCTMYYYVLLVGRRIFASTEVQKRFLGVECQQAEGSAYHWASWSSWSYDLERRTNTKGKGMSITLFKGHWHLLQLYFISLFISCVLSCKELDVFISDFSNKSWGLHFKLLLREHFVMLYSADVSIVCMCSMCTRCHEVTWVRAGRCIHICVFGSVLLM